MERERELEERIEWLERAVITLSSAPGAPKLPPRPAGTGAPEPSMSTGADGADPPQEVLALLDGGHEVRAIKAYRDATGAGIKEAKAEIERLKQLRG